MRWLVAVRELAAAQVASARERWRGLSRSATVHDAIDEILAGPLAGMGTEHAAAARAALAEDPRWRRLTEELGVPVREAELLALVTACELEPGLTRVLGYLDDSAAPAPPTPANAALLWGWPLGYQPGPASALGRWRLAGPNGAWQRTTPWTVDGGVAAFLAGVEDWAGFDAAVSRPEVRGLDCLHPKLLAGMLAGLTRLGAGDCEVELIGPPGSGRRTLLTQLALAAGREPVLLRGDDPVRAARTARLLGAVPVLVDDARGELDGRGAGGSGAAPAAVRGDVTLVARTRPATGDASTTFRRLSWTLPPTTRAQRQRLWAAHTSAPPPRSLSEWDLSPADVAAGAAVAAAGLDVAEATIRQRLRTGAVRSMTAVELPYEWDDLVVADAVAAQLKRLRNQVLLARDVLQGWEFDRLSPATRGITALFAGPSGTGKTMAAQVLARSLGLDLFRVDLAEVVDKYIGETEKRLQDVFAECERSHVMVFFDEADALFGQRTRVRDAHDRYANIEIDYLLQRLDTFGGVAVLATNRKSDLDPAFLRRLRVIVDFVAPAPAERLRLWRRALPERTSSGEVLTDAMDREWLAAHLELTGAEITAVAVNAAFEARADGGRIGRGHVLDAARRELAKRGGVLRPESSPELAVAR
jgi:DNA polymerase III delta prime subunit